MSTFSITAHTPICPAKSLAKSPSMIGPPMGRAGAQVPGTRPSKPAPASGPQDQPPAALSDETTCCRRGDFLTSLFVDFSRIKFGCCRIVMPIGGFRNSVQPLNYRVVFLVGRQTHQQGGCHQRRRQSPARHEAHLPEPGVRVSLLRSEPKSYRLPRLQRGLCAGAAGPRDFPSGKDSTPADEEAGLSGREAQVRGCPCGGRRRARSGGR